MTNFLKKFRQNAHILKSRFSVSLSNFKSRVLGILMKSRSRSFNQVSVSNVTFRLHHWCRLCVFVPCRLRCKTLKNYNKLTRNKNRGREAKERYLRGRSEQKVRNHCSKSLNPEANFHFRGPRLFSIGGPSRRFTTTDVIKISTTRARYIHWTSSSNS